ncbi:hypothetical protein ARMSODRAFT_130317 [Armillaria solidipes]|uniref:Uncharacterized protein n=1 Tax=Armillaria solidipes TaxID=1076256 RepID=A0A2H3BMS3_9AGAR|nr:hypothetical protein ARMSODRAFT_130317 [Armillaria solidipes]
MIALWTVSLPQTSCNPRVVNSHAPWFMLLCRNILGIGGDHCYFMLSSSRSFLRINRKKRDFYHSLDALRSDWYHQVPGRDSWVFKRRQCVGSHLTIMYWKLLVVTLAFTLAVSAMPTVDFPGGGAPPHPTDDTLSGSAPRPQRAVNERSLD